MAIEQPTTLRVVSGGKVVEADWLPSGVPGLALVGQPVADGWRLVHMASGRAVSRSAEHSDPEIIRALAREIASFADWTQPTSQVAVPQLRERLDRALEDWHAANPPSNPSSDPSAKPSPAHRPPEPKAAAPTRTDPEEPGGGNLVLDQDLERLVARLRAAERERVLLREVVRKLRSEMSPSTFADALSGLSQSDREFVQSLLADRNAADATAVVQVFRRDTQSTSRMPTRPRPPRVSGSDVAAS